MILHHCPRVFNRLSSTSQHVFNSPVGGGRTVGGTPSPQRVPKPFRRYDLRMILFLMACKSSQRLRSSLSFFSTTLMELSTVE